MKIGIFDSGIGGLTVFKEISKKSGLSQELLQKVSKILVTSGLIGVN